MAFEGFELSQIDLGEVSLRVRHGGAGPPLLLLHGYPQTHMMWAPVANDLARDFTVIAPDLRGYGGSTAPADADESASYSKRAMAADAVALMAHFGFGRFDVVGHDRGGRVAYRLALDHPDAVRRLAVLDIVPTGEVWARADARFAMGYWHWPFLAQRRGVPETLIGADPEYFFFEAHMPGLADFCAPEALAEYRAFARQPSVIHAICEDYRAGAGYDRRLDAADQAAGRTIACPTLALWGDVGAVGAWYDVLEVWRAWAPDIRGHAVASGHFIPEENPAATMKALRDFFAEGG